MKPTQKEINQMLATAKLASKRAGNYLMKNFRKNSYHDYGYKKHREIVTRRDTDTNKIIVKIIKAKFPHHNIISEEAKYKKNKSPFTWFIDPLDGTTNYTAGNPLFAVNIGITYQDQIIIGAINVPYTKDLCWAVKSKGAYCGNKKIKVSKTNILSESFIQLCHSYEANNRKRGAQIVNRITGKVRVYRRFGCAGVEHTNVATGRAEAIVIIGSRSWDNLAGALIIEEAGGKATDRQGKLWQPNSKDFIATNGKIHKQLLKIIK